MKVVQTNPGVIDQFSIKTEDGWYDTYLSNGHIEPDGTFVEREYQAAKANNLKDATIILASEKPFGPSGAKRLGREVKIRPDWDEVKFQVMTRLVMAKFADHSELAKQLLATGDTLLIEGNTWHDNIWGDCRCGRAECSDPGLNWLGHILMVVREALRNNTA